MPFENVVPDGAAWFITDDTGNCWEIKFLDSWCGRHIFKGQYAVLMALWSGGDATEHARITKMLRDWKYPGPGSDAILGLKE